jgi:hypothetical protein
MKTKFLKSLSATVLATFCSHVGTSYATLIAGWDFQGSSTGTVGTVIIATPNTPTVFNANDGVNLSTAALYLDGTNGSSAWAAATQLNGFGGTSLNTSGTNLNTSTTSPAALALVNSTANGFNAVFKFDLTGYGSLSLTYAGQKTGTGFSSEQWAYSTDGINFTNWDSAITLPAAFAVQTLSTITAVDNASTVYVRLTVTGASSGSGNNRLDNIQFNADPVPEPGTVALVGLGLGAVLFGIRRRVA